MVSYQALTAVFCIILLAIQDLQLPTLAYSGSGCEFVCLDIDYLFEESKKKKSQKQGKIALPEGKLISCSVFTKKVPGASYDTYLYFCRLF